MSEKFFVGRDIVSFSNNGKFKPISRVTLLLDDENSLTAGDDTGMELVASCRYGTQAMVEALLAQLAGYEYHAFEAGEAGIDPAVELGDGVTVNGIYSVVAQISDDGDGYPSLSAPGEAEMEDEFPAPGPMTQEFNRKIAETRSLITKTAEEIQLRIEGLDGSISALSVTIDGVTITGSNGETLIKGSSIDTSTIRANSISADQVNLSGAITFGDLSDDVVNDINDAYSMASDASDVAAAAQKTVSGWTYRGSTYIDGSKIMAGTVMASQLLGGSVSLLNQWYGVVGELSITGASSAYYAVDLTSYGALRFTAYGAIYMSNSGTSIGLDGTNISVGCECLYPAGTAAYLGSSTMGMWQAVYAYTGAIQTSDRNLKNSIEPLPEKYVAMFDGLEVVRYKMNNGTSDRYHVGFVAQDVFDKAMTPAGVDSQEFGGFIKDTDANGNDIYMLRYEEFIGVLAAKIKQLETRIYELEAKA